MRGPILIALALVGATCGPSGGAKDAAPRPDLSSPAGPSVARGEYLAKSLLFCGDCHTTPDATGLPSTAPGDFLAGGRFFPVGAGKVYAKNITPDRTTGVGAWTTVQIKNAILHGVDDMGLPLSPIMPYPTFANLTPDDATSIALFIQSLPPKVNPVPDDTAMTAAVAATVPDDRVPHTTLAPADPSHDAAERGRYLAEIACLDCHTPDAAPGGGPDLSRPFGGGRRFPLGPITTVSANLTPAATGLAGWTSAEIAATLRLDEERGRGRPLCPPMPAGPSRLGSLGDGDLADVSAYVHSLPPVANGPFGCSDGGVPYGVPDGG